jgi:hypothetical protein
MYQSVRSGTLIALVKSKGIALMSFSDFGMLGLVPLLDQSGRGRVSQ